MNLKNIYIIVAILLTISLVSCDSDDATGHSNVKFTAPTATYAIIGDNLNLIVDESLIDPDADEQDAATGVYKYGVYLVEATIPEAVQFDTYIDLTQTAGTATNADFEIERIKIPALQTTGVGKITIFSTGDLEGDETLVISANTNSPNINGTQDFTFEITNDFLNEDFIVTFSWCGEYEFEIDDNGTTIAGDFGDNLDLDVLLYDSGFNFLGYLAGTSACPEEANLANLPSDGTYYLTVDVYENSLSGFGLNESIPFSITYEREFFVPKTNFIHNFSLNTDTPGSGGGGGTPVIQVDKTGNDYVLTAI